MITNNTYEVSDVIEFLHDLTQEIRCISSWCRNRYNKKNNAMFIYIHSQIMLYNTSKNRKEIPK